MPHTKPPHESNAAPQSTMTTRMTDGVDRNQPAYWDRRFAEAGYAYGVAPNDFLVSALPKLTRGAALCLCEGEGRNAVHLALNGFAVTAVDFSEVGLQKAITLATSRGVGIATECADLADFAPGVGKWDVITMIFGQPEPAVRAALYARIARALRPGGAFVLETKVEAGADGASRYPGSAVLQGELVGLDFRVAHDLTRALTEGRYHKGEQHVAQILAMKPIG